MTPPSFGEGALLYYGAVASAAVPALRSQLKAQLESRIVASRLVRRRKHHLSFELLRTPPVATLHSTRAHLCSLLAAGPSRVGLLMRKALLSVWRHMQITCAAAR